MLFATSASFGPEVRRAGFESVAAGIDWVESDVERIFPELGERRLSREAELRWWLTDVWGGRFLAAAAPDLVAVIRDWGADVVVHEQWELAGALAAEVAGVPYAMHGHGLFMSAATWDQIAGPQLDRARREVGLAPDPGQTWIHRWLYLDPVPPSFQLPCAVTAIRRFRPVFREVRADAAGDDAWPPTPMDTPRIYASMGTVFRCPDHVHRSILEGLAGERVRLLLVVGRERDPDAFGPQPDHVRVERWVPQAEVLAHADAVITHAGYNTVAETLWAGLPLLAVPLHANQPSVAKRCDVLGVGLRLRVEDVTPESVRSAVHRLLAEPSYGDAARRIRDEFASMPPIESAVDALRQLAER